MYSTFWCVKARPFHPLRRTRRVRALTYSAPSCQASPNAAGAAHTRLA
jgi:hypothetical protein